MCYSCLLEREPTSIIRGNLPADIQRHSGKTPVEFPKQVVLFMQFETQQRRRAEHGYGPLLSLSWADTGPYLDITRPGENLLFLALERDLMEPCVIISQRAVNRWCHRSWRCLQQTCQTLSARAGTCARHRGSPAVLQCHRQHHLNQNAAMSHACLQVCRSCLPTPLSLAATLTAHARAWCRHVLVRCNVADSPTYPQERAERPAVSAFLYKCTSPPSMHSGYPEGSTLFSQQSSLACIGG